MQLSNTEETQPGLRMHNPLSLCDKCWMAKDLLMGSTTRFANIREGWPWQDSPRFPWVCFRGFRKSPDQNSAA
jgi:hypothetical protein